MFVGAPGGGDRGCDGGRILSSSVLFFLVAELGVGLKKELPFFGTLHRFVCCVNLTLSGNTTLHCVQCKCSFAGLLSQTKSSKPLGRRLFRDDRSTMLLAIVVQMLEYQCVSVRSLWE